MAKRIQRKRTKGWQMPAGAIYVGRPTTWGNCYIVGVPTMDPVIDDYVIPRDRADAVSLYRRMWEHWLATDTLGGGRSPYHAFDRIRGHDLVCWCALDQPCHADVLLDLANPAASLPETPEA